VWTLINNNKNKTFGMAHRNVVQAFAAFTGRPTTVLRQALILLVPRREYLWVTHAVTGETVCRVYLRRHLCGRDVVKTANAEVDPSMETRLWHDAERMLRVDADFAFSDAEEWTDVFADVLPSFRNWSCLRTLTGHTNCVRSVAWCPHNSTKLASGSVDGTVKIWNVETGQCLRALTGHIGSVTSVTWHPGDGTKVVSGSVDRTVQIWDVATGACLRTLEGHSRGVSSVTWHPHDGTKLASGSYDDTIKIWDVETGRCLRTLKGHFSVRSVAWHPGDGTEVASGSLNSVIQIWGASAPFNS